MTTQISGIVIDGQLQLDRPLELPDHSRVNIIVESATADATDWDVAMDAFKQLRKKYPIHSGGLRFTREELHERRGDPTSPENGNT